MAGVEYHVEGMPEVRRMLAQFEGRQLQNKMLKAVRRGAKPFQSTLKATAAAEPTGNVPASFQKVRAPKVSTRGGASGRDIEAYVRPRSPLFNIFQPGATAHTIAPNEFVTGRPGRRGGIHLDRHGREVGRRKAALAGPPGEATWTPTGRKRGARFFSRRPVRHPGMAPRDILSPAFRAGERAATDAIADAIFAINRGEL